MQWLCERFSCSTSIQYVPQAPGVRLPAGLDPSHLEAFQGRSTAHELSVDLLNEVLPSGKHKKSFEMSADPVPYTALQRDLLGLHFFAHI